MLRLYKYLSLLLVTRRVMSTIVLACIASVFMLQMGYADEPKASSASPALSEMSKLSFLAGEWRGHAWMDGPNGRLEFPQSKIVRPFMSGLVYGIEGDSITEANTYYHETLVMVSYDGKHPYRIHAYGGPNAIADGDALLSNGTFQWQFIIGKMRCRYLIHINAKGQWEETGDRSFDDGATWNTFTGAYLDKVK
jgi:hypothetical protein